MVAVNFSPRNRDRNGLRRVATPECFTHLHGTTIAPRRAAQLHSVRGLKPTATIAASLRDAFFSARAAVIPLLIGLVPLLSAADATHFYENRLTRIQNPKPLLAEHPEWVEPIRETKRFETPALVNDPGADCTCARGGSLTTRAASSKCRIISAPPTRPSSWFIRGASTMARAGTRRNPRVSPTSARRRKIIWLRATRAASSTRSSNHFAAKSRSFFTACPAMKIRFDTSSTARSRIDPLRPNDVKAPLS